MELPRVDIRTDPIEPRIDKLDREDVLGISARFGDEAEGDGGFEEEFGERWRFRYSWKK